MTTKESATVRVYNRDGSEYGQITGTERPCQLEGCRGRRQGVRWADNHITWPCTAGLNMRQDGSYQII